jgi:hypothetical protein
LDGSAESSQSEALDVRTRNTISPRNSRQDLGKIAEGVRRPNERVNAKPDQVERLPRLEAVAEDDDAHITIPLGHAVEVLRSVAVGKIRDHDAGQSVLEHR